MNKKLISALFVGALLLGSTSALTSCKDYDDDINDLQAQIDKKALQADVDALKTSLASATATATAAQTTANSALAAAQKANDAVALKAAQADLDAAVKRIAALETKTAELEAFEKKLQDAVDSEISKLETEFATLKSEISDLIGQMITNVSLVATLYGWDEDENAVAAYHNRDVAIYNTYEKANVFGKDMTGAITFTAGKLVNFAEGVIIRVTPTSVDLTKDAVIKLVRSNGNAEVNNMMEVASVEKYTGDILVSRAASTMETGLWIVKFKLTDAYNADDFNALTLNDSGKYQDGYPWAHYYGYGIQINNTANNETRYAPSEYNVALMTKAVKDEIEELFTVNGKPITELHNRYQWCENEEQTKTFTATAPGVSKYSKFIDELTWSANKKNPAVSASAGDVIYKTDTGKDGGNMTNNDNRQGQPLLPVTVNQNIKISFNYATAFDGEYIDDNVSVRGFYVTLDTQNALESAPSEINAWNSYSYEGLNTVQEGKTAIIKITANKANGDKIGFRVYAVNYDGTLVDPDGRAFYVVVGEAAKATTFITTIIPPTGYYEGSVQAPFTSDYVAISDDFSDIKDAGSVTIEPDANNPLIEGQKLTDTEFGVIYFDKDKKALGANEYDKAKYMVSYILPQNAKNFIDGKTYTETVTYKNSDGNIIRVITIQMTKQMPTGLPAAGTAFAPKDKQVIDGIYRCYLTPDQWDANQATNGHIALNNGFDGLYTNTTPSTVMDYNFVFNFATSQKDAKNKDVTLVVPSTYGLTVAKSYIDNTTEHATSVDYNYKAISTYYDTEAKAWKVGQDYYVKDVYTFKTIYCCYYDASVMTWAWAKDTKTAIKYGTAGQTIATKAISGTNTFNATDFSKDLSEFLAAKKLSVKEAHLYTVAGNVKDQYFTVSVDATNITFAPNPSMTGDESNPKADVASKLIITALDCYGHEVAISLDATVNPK